MAGPSGEAVPDTRSGGLATEPSRLNNTRRTTCTLLVVSIPEGGLQHSSTLRRNASNSLCESCAAGPLLRPSDGALLSVSPAAANRVESRLSSNASTFLGSNLGAGGAGFLGGTGGLASAFFGSCLACSLTRVSAIGSGFASACLISLGLASAGLVSTGLASGGGEVSRAAFTS